LPVLVDALFKVWQSDVVLPETFDCRTPWEGALLQSSLLWLVPFSSQYPVDALAKPLGKKKQCLDGRRPLPALYLRKVPLANSEVISHVLLENIPPELPYLYGSRLPRQTYVLSISSGDLLYLEGEWFDHAIETAALMLGTDKSRGYCLEMICAASLAGANLDNEDPTMLLQSMSRFFKFLPGEQRQTFLHEVAGKVS
jgi:hypothetical protein